MMSPAPLVWINGFPGYGKLAVATQMAALQKTAVVIDNHKLIDPVEAQYPRSHPDYQRQRQLFQEKVLDEYVGNTAMLSRTIIFTDFQSDNELGRHVALEYRDAASKAGRPFLLVYMICDAEANLERVATFDRLHGGTNKLTDARVLRASASAAHFSVLTAARASRWILRLSRRGRLLSRSWPFRKNRRALDKRRKRRKYSCRLENYKWASQR